MGIWACLKFKCGKMLGLIRRCRRKCSVWNSRTPFHIRFNSFKSLKNINRKPTELGSVFLSKHHVPSTKRNRFSIEKFNPPLTTKSSPCQKQFNRYQKLIASANWMPSRCNAHTRLHSTRLDKFTHGFRTIYINRKTTTSKTFSYTRSPSSPFYNSLFWSIVMRPPVALPSVIIYLLRTAQQQLREKNRFRSPEYTSV